MLGVGRLPTPRPTLHTTVSLDTGGLVIGLREVSILPALVTRSPQKGQCTVYRPPYFKTAVIVKPVVVLLNAYTTVSRTHRKKPTRYESHTLSALPRERARAGSVTVSQGPTVLSRGTDCQVIAAYTHLLVYLGPTFYFSYDHSHDGAPVGCGKGKELLVGGDITIP